MTVALCPAGAGFIYTRELGALVPRELGAGWMLLALSKLPRTFQVLSSPPFTTVPTCLRSSESPPGSWERQAKNVPSGLGAGNPEGNPEALAAIEPISLSAGTR